MRNRLVSTLAWMVFWTIVALIGGLGLYYARALQIHTTKDAIAYVASMSIIGVALGYLWSREDNKLDRDFGLRLTPTVILIMAAAAGLAFYVWWLIEFS